MKTKALLLQMICGLLIALFSYAAMSKLMDYDRALSQMRGQVFPTQIANILTWFVPTVELLVVGLLLFIKTRRIGLWASLLLMTAFTLYIALTMSGAFGKIPCSCGSILEKMSYQTHLLFNLFFMALAAIGIFLVSNRSIAQKWFNVLKRKETA